MRKSSSGMPHMVTGLSCSEGSCKPKKTVFKPMTWRNWWEKYLVKSEDKEDSQSSDNPTQFHRNQKTRIIFFVINPPHVSIRVEFVHCESTDRGVLSL